MAQTLAHDDPDFDAAYARLIGAKRESAEDVDRTVAGIVADVRARGLDAVIELTRRFDRWEADAGSLAYGPDDIDRLTAEVSDEDRAALALAADRIRSYHRRQVPPDERWEDAAGVTLGWRWTAVDAAGLYVPGGTASYPSSLLMNAIPAEVAGVGRVEMCVPTPDGAVNPLVLLAARLAGVDRIWRVGGAQAVAAMAYGAGPIGPVDKIVGPGNAWVAAAKRQVFGQVGIDSIAGPSEVIVVADAASDPDWVAVDLLSQAEHDASAQAICLTDDAAFGAEVARAVERRLQALPRAEIAGASWRDNGAVVVARDLDHAAELVDRAAPEHLELSVEDPEALMKRIRHAGAIFLGRSTPEAIGDYVGGPNHVLPTSRTARFSSGLSVLDFMKRTTFARVSEGGMLAVGPAAHRLATAEGLDAHALSVALRLDALAPDGALSPLATRADAPPTPDRRR